MLTNLKRNILVISTVICFMSNSAFAFVGLYATKDGSKVTSSNSKVAIAHKNKKTILTLTSDFDTSATEFALIIPVPSTIKTANVRSIDYESIHKLEIYTSPRLIEYIDYDPCNPDSIKRPPIITTQSFTTIDMDKATPLKSKIHKTIAPHNVIVLTSKESIGINLFLKKHGYKLPEQHLGVLEYAAARMKFVVVELRKDADNTANWLEPVQIEYDESEEEYDGYGSDILSLPTIGSLNSPENQKHNMLLFALSSHGEILSHNYQTKDMPGNIDLPVTSISEFTKFYADFTNKIFDAHPGIIRKEYSWPMGACKPCTSEPLSIEELSKLGTFWYHLPEEGRLGLVAPFSAIYVTRLHAQYGYSNIIDNLTLKESTEKDKYQTYFNIKKPIPADQSKCGSKYTSELKKAEEQQNKNFQLLY